MAASVSCLRLAGIALVLAMVNLPLAACSDESHVTVHTAKGTYTFHIELADTEAQREKGLMFRTELAPDAGMLFDFHESQPVQFWMQNTLIPLDMVFISADGVVKSIHVNARPMDRTPIPSGAPVRFVLEIAGGRSVETGMAPGDKVDYARIAERQ